MSLLPSNFRRRFGDLLLFVAQLSFEQRFPAYLDSALLDVPALSAGFETDGFAA